MNDALRLMGVLILLLPMHLLACMDVVEFEVADVRIVGGSDAGREEEEADIVEDVEVDVGVGVDVDEELLNPDDFEFSERELAGGEQLVIEPDQPSLEILFVERREGTEGYFLSVDCHDDTPGLKQNWVRGSGRYASQNCEVELATAIRAIEVEPAVDFRIAPTPSGFRLVGDFQRGSYELRLKAGLRSEAGAVLKEDFTETIEVPALSASVQFAAQGRYLPRGAWEELVLRHRNVEEVTVELRHVPRQNLAFWIADARQQVDQRTSDRVMQTTIAVSGEEDEMVTSRLALDEHLGEPSAGLYQLVARGAGTRATTLLQVTDINLLVKRHELGEGELWPRGIDAWALDMQTTRPISGVRVEAIRPSGKAMARCTTDRNGHCRLTLPEDDIDTTPPIAVLAEKGQDLTYLKFADLRTTLPEGEVTGPPYLEQRAYAATIYGDRDLYRPGDEFHLIGVVRDGDYVAAEAGIPLSIVVRDPQNKVVVEEQRRTDELGLVELSFPINEVAPTGRWRAELEVGARLLETYFFHVEEFVPERLEASARAQAPSFVRGGEASFDVHARYLFGASAEGSEVEARCRLVPLPATRAEGFHFGPVDLAAERKIVDLPVVYDVIGAEDQVQLSCPQAEQEWGGPARLEATFAISEAGSGRTTRASASATLHPSPFHVGLKSSAETLAGGDTFSVEGVVRDLDGHLLEDIEQEVTLEFYNLRQQFSRQYDRAKGHYTHHYSYQFLLERVVDVHPVEGRFAFETTAADVTNGYLVRARLGDSVTELHLGRSGRYWHWVGNQDRTPRPLRPARVVMNLPETAPLGAPTEVEFIAPFAGRALLSVETDQVLHQQWVEAKNGRNRWSFTLDEFLPNVYVSAFIIADPGGGEGAGFAPERAFGAASIAVERGHLESPIHLEVPEEVRPGEVLEVRLAAGKIDGPAQATIAAVDEGILQLTDYLSPDPLRALLVRRGLGVETFDTVGWATQLPPAGPSSRTGGGAFEEVSDASSGRILPFRPVSLWSGLVEVDEEGEATVRFEVPNYRGRLRVMAAVFTEDRIGSAEADVVVRDPLTVQTTFPRFLIVGDEVKIPVFLANLTDEDRQIEVSIATEEYDLPGFDVAGEDSALPILEFIDGDEVQMELAAGESTTVYFTARSIRPGGAAQMQVRAESGELSSVDEGMIPFRSGGPRERISRVVTLDSSATFDLNAELAGWVPASEETTLWVSAMPQPEAFDHLEYLIRYPYGCAEQTVSSVRPLLFISQFVEAIDPQSVLDGGGVSAMVNHGINRILSMQGPHGAISYWPGSTWYSAWVTAYALHFLLDAVDQGYGVPSSRIRSAVDWLKSNSESGFESAYIHYVLALAGEAQGPQIRRAIEELPPDLSSYQAESAYLLWAALYLSGDRSFEEELRNPMIELPEGGRRSRGGFYSHYRQLAKRLNVFVDLFGHDENGRELAEAVLAQLATPNRRGHYTTQEVVWSVTGLGKWYQRDGGEIAEVKLTLNGREIRPGRKVQGLPAWSVARASEMSQVSLNVERFDEEATLYAVLTSEGVRQTPNVRYGGEGLALERTYLRDDGSKWEGEELSLGELIYVRLRVSNQANKNLEHVALAERLPAGLEVENPDLGSAPLPLWASPTWEVDHSNMRDDRAEFFGPIRSGATVEVVFAARATLSGHFHVPSVEVGAMYEPQYWARERGGELRISAPGDALVD